MAVQCFCFAVSALIFDVLVAVSAFRLKVSKCFF